MVYNNSMRFSLIACLLSLFLVGNCAIFVDEYQNNQKEIIDFLLADLPIPKDSKIKKDSTILLGNGDNVSGRILLDSKSSPSENLIFYTEQAAASGWELMSSKVGQEITLIYFKNGRYATLQMAPDRSFTSFMVGKINSSINISITFDSPFQGLTDNTN